MLKKGRDVMRAFEGKNYYEILNLPLGAGLTEVKLAYTEALEMYGEDALATYALFSDEQRKEILTTIEAAFQTLSNGEKRTEYNRMLISTGQVEADMLSEQSRNSDVKQLEDQNSLEPGAPADSIEQYPRKIKIKKMIDEISEKDLVSGQDLRRIREALGIDLSQIFKRTRISKTTLQNMEENQYEDLPAKVFLKSFLKSYAEILQIDPTIIVDGYMKNIEASNKGGSSLSPKRFQE
jgi:curved DNA-binding protein CbpA